MIKESIAVDRFDRWRAQNIVPRAINGMHANGSPSLPALDSSECRERTGDALKTSLSTDKTPPTQTTSLELS
ncbi:hypothetical protein TNCV_3115951 [Trichonephila clavipes]|nr:hypothetical protein TNCV_3115951 [Trichonephila clavipes]